VRIDSEKDRVIGEWVLKEFGADRITAVVAELGSRAWPAKVAAKLGTRVPDEIWDPEAAAVSEEIRSTGREKLRQLRNQIAAGLK
jgi:hypothetical protein